MPGSDGPLSPGTPVEASSVPETATSPTVTGAVTGAVTWFPPAVESDPSVDPDEAAGAEPEPDPAAVPPEVEASSVPDTATSPTVTGAVTGAVTWFPPAVESDPSV
ncbi:MAG TPA: hypothetical protein VIB11_02500, partial [Pedococcus sp.]